MQWPFQGHSARTKPATYMSGGSGSGGGGEEGSSDGGEGGGGGGGGGGGAGCGGGAHVLVYDAKKVTCKFLSGGRRRMAFI